jgi:hypothetical protein
MKDNLFFKDIVMISTEGFMELLINGYFAIH